MSTEASRLSPAAAPIGEDRVRDRLTVPLLLVLACVAPPMFVFERFALTGVNKPLIAAVIGCLAVVVVRRFAFSISVLQLTYFQLAQAALILALPFFHLSFGYDLGFAYFSTAFQLLASAAVFAIFASAGRVEMLGRLWVNLHLVMGLFGLLVFTSGLLFNIQPIATFLDRPYYDFGLAYTNIFIPLGDAKIIRVAGFYDEPGTFAFYTVIAIFVARLYGMPRWKELALLALGLTSLSMALIITGVLWLLLATPRRHYKYVLLVSLITVAGFSQLDESVRDAVHGATVERFSAGGSGTRLLKGDNRSEIMTANYEAFLDSPYIGHGPNHEDHVGNVYGPSFIANPAAPLASHGLLGTVIINAHVALLFLLLLRSRSVGLRDRIAILIVLTALLAQRPTTIDGFSYLIFFIMIDRLLACARAAIAP